MAIVFISPKKRQKKFFWLLSITVLLAIFTVSSIIFLPEIGSMFNIVIVDQPILQGPDIVIQMHVLDTEQVRSLEPFEQLKIEFSYTAKNAEEKEAAGTIMAFDREHAAMLLTSMGLSSLNLTEIRMGRNEPFIPY